MAIPLAFRVAIYLAPVVGAGGAKLVRYVQGPGLPATLKRTQWVLDKLRDPNVSDAELSEDLTRLNGYPVTVATYTGDFEVRRIHVEWSVSGPTLLDEDIRVVTFHSIKISGGVPSDVWDQANFDELVARILTWWNTLKPWYSTNFVLTGIKFYKAGPNIVPPQPPVFSSVQDQPGTAAATNLPPQVALSVTEMAGTKKGWGRFYMPAPQVQSGQGAATCTNAGRPSTNFTTAVIDATDALYEAALAASLPFVVYRQTLAANRPTGSPPAPSELPERPANAEVVEKLQVDDVFDVIRSRRWEAPTLRLQREIGGPAAVALPAAGVIELVDELSADAQEDSTEA